MPTQASYRPPKEMLNNISRGADLKKRWSRGGAGAAAVSAGGSDAGLADGEALSLGAVKKVKAFFDQHPDSFTPDDLAKDGGPNLETIDWLLWGGTAAKKWAAGLIEKFTDEDIDDNDFNYNTSIIKVDDTLGLVLGWAIISKQDGQDYYDVQGDHIPEDAMLKAAADFMQGARVVGDMHEKEEGGQVVFAFPMTEEVAKAFGITTKNTGLMIGIKPQDQKTLAKYKDGTYTGFSIGGQRVTDDDSIKGVINHGP